MRGITAATTAPAPHSRRKRHRRRLLHYQISRAKLHPRRPCLTTIRSPTRRARSSRQRQRALHRAHRGAAAARAPRRGGRRRPAVARGRPPPLRPRRSTRPTSAAASCSRRRRACACAPAASILDYAVSSVSGSGPSGRRPQGGYAFPEVAGGLLEESSLRVRLRLDADRWTEWPGKPNHGQLPGTFRTWTAWRCRRARLRRAAGAQQSGAENSHCEMGLISRDGWAPSTTPSAAGSACGGAATPARRRRSQAGSGGRRRSPPASSTTRARAAKTRGARDGRARASASPTLRSCSVAPPRAAACARRGGARGGERAARLLSSATGSTMAPAARLLAGGRRAAAAARGTRLAVVLAVVAVCRFRDERARRPV